MSFLKRKAKMMGAVASAVMSVALLGSSLIYAGMTNNYKSWKQTGSSWSSMTLGTNGGTVANFGCAVTSAAILMVKSGSVTDSDFNPGVLIEYLNQNNGFSADGDLNWDALAWYAPDFKFDSRINLFGTDEEKIERVQGLLEEGYYMIAQVKNGAHFVAVDAVRGSEITMMDPGSTSNSLNEKYGIDSMISLRVFKTANSVPDVPEKVQETEIQEEVDAPETAPEMIPEAPATAPYVPETIAETVTEMTTTTISTTNASTMPTTMMPVTAVETTTSTAVTTMTTKQETAPEIIIMTKATTTTTANAMTETKRPEIVMPAEDVMPEILIDPITEECEDDTDPVQIVILETAPVIAPDVENAVMTEETKAVYVPDDQAEAVLFKVKEQNLYMTVRFYIQNDVNLLTTPDTSADVLAVIPANTCLDVVEIDGEFKWGKVLYENQEGWISLNFTSLSPQNENE